MGCSTWQMRLMIRRPITFTLPVIAPAHPLELVRAATAAAACAAVVNC